MADALATNTVALVAAVGRAGLLRACLPCESNLAIAGSIKAIAVVAAVAWASIKGTVVPSPAGFTRAGKVVLGANSVARTSIWANLLRAIPTLKTRIAVAHTIVAEASIRAIVQACLNGTICPTPCALTIASTIEACSVSRAVVFTLKVAAVETTKPIVAVAGKVAADPLSRALIRACFH